MRITSKGQVTIPAEIRERAGLLPYTEVEFEFSRAKPSSPIGDGEERSCRHYQIFSSALMRPSPDINW